MNIRPCLTIVLYYVLFFRYDPRANKWTTGSAMSTRRKHLGCAVYNNMIYAVGGRDDATELSSAEIYNNSTGIISLAIAEKSDNEH